MLSFEVELQATEMFIIHIKDIFRDTNLYRKYSRHLENHTFIFGMAMEACHYFDIVDIAFRPEKGVIIRSGATGNGNVNTTCQRSR